MNRKKILLGCLVVLALLTLACNDLGGGDAGFGKRGDYSENAQVNPFSDGGAAEDPGLEAQHDEMYDVTMGKGEHSGEQ